MNENYLRLILWKEVTVLILWMAATTCEWIGEGGGVELRLRGRDLLEPLLSLQIRLSLPPKPLPIGSDQHKSYNGGENVFFCQQYIYGDKNYFI